MEVWCHRSWWGRIGVEPTKRREWRWETRLWRGIKGRSSILGSAEIQLSMQRQRWQAQRYSGCCTVHYVPSSRSSALSNLRFPWPILRSVGRTSWNSAACTFFGLLSSTYACVYFSLEIGTAKDQLWKDFLSDGRYSGAGVILSHRSTRMVLISQQAVGLPVVFISIHQWLRRRGRGRGRGRGRAIYNDQVTPSQYRKTWGSTWCLSVPVLVDSKNVGNEFVQQTLSEAAYVIMRFFFLESDPAF